MKNISKIAFLFLALPFNCMAMHELKEKQEASSELTTKINKYRSTYLEKYLLRDLSNIVQEYDPIQDKWECETTLEGHQDYVTASCLLPGNKLASGSNKTIKIWNLTSGRCETTLEGHQDYVYALCLLPENKLASGSNKTIKIWNLSSGKCETTLEDHQGLVYALCLLPGNKLASVSRNETIKIWNLASGKCETTLEGHEGFVNALCLLPGNKLASGSNKTIKIWNLTSGKCETTLKGHQYRVNALCLLPGNKLASGSNDGTIKIWSNQALLLDFPDEEFVKFIHERESLATEVVHQKQKESNCIVS